METFMELEIKKQSWRLWIKPETSFWRKVYLLVLRFLIIQMSNKSSLSLSSMNLAIDFFCRVCLPPYESKNVWKKKLKLPAKTICLLYKSLIVFNFLFHEELLIAVSVLVLYMLTRTKLVSSTLTSNIKYVHFIDFFI